MRGHSGKHADLRKIRQCFHENHVKEKNGNSEIRSGEERGGFIINCWHTKISTTLAKRLSDSFSI